MIQSIKLTNEWVDLKTSLSLKEDTSYLFSNNGTNNLLLSEEITGKNTLRLNSNQVNVALLVGSSLFARTSGSEQSGTLTVTDNVSGGGGAGNTDLGFLETDTGFNITSSTGNAAEVPNATSLLNGAMSKEDKAKLDGLTNGIVLQGNWNASTNTPDISGTTKTGYAWIVSVAGDTDLGGIDTWDVNDIAVKTADGWAKIDNSETVTSVNGETGDVQLESDISSFTRTTTTYQIKSTFSGGSNSTNTVPLVDTAKNWAGLISASSQTKLDGIQEEATKNILVAGTNITITNDGAGTQTINSTGGGDSADLNIIVADKGANDFYTLTPTSNDYYLRGKDEIVIDLTGIEDGVVFTISSASLTGLGQVYVKGSSNALVVSSIPGNNLSYAVGLDTKGLALVDSSKLADYEVAGKGIPLCLNAPVAQYSFVVNNGNLLGF